MAETTRPTPVRRTGRTRWAWRLGRGVVLATVLALAAVLVPDSAPRSEQAALVRLERATAVDVDPATVWILAVGSDARPGQDMSRARADALQMVGINTRTGTASAIGIPRDSWMPIPGHGSNRVNAALYFGGPQLLGRTVGNFLGVQPDYVFVTRFEGIERMVGELGGITVSNPFRFGDVNLKKEGFKAGRVRLSGYDAMAFSRIRKELPTGDFGRSANQQRVLRGIHAEVRAHAESPGFLERGVLSVVRHMRTDLPPAELFRLAQAVAQVRPGRISTCVVQGAIGNVGGASVVLPNVEQARGYARAARKDGSIGRC